MDKQEYTALRASGHETFFAETVEEFQCKLNRWSEQSGYVYDAWASAFPSYGRYDELRAESIAAGRLIENIDGQWVARGVEEEKYSEWDAEDNHRRNDQAWAEWDKLNAELNAAMIARDDTDAARRQAETRKYLDQVEQMLAATLPSTAKPNPFQSFRNPDSCNGPADHLNAARHQMAGMKAS